MDLKNKTGNQKRRHFLCLKNMSLQTEKDPLAIQACYIELKKIKDNEKTQGLLKIIKENKFAYNIIRTGMALNLAIIIEINWKAMVKCFQNSDDILFSF